MNIKAITLDTGGTILDWHSGVRAALERVGLRHNLSRDWATLTNDYRRLAMKGIVGQIAPAFHMDDVHRSALNELLELNGLAAFSNADREEILRSWHQLAAWPDFPSTLTKLRRIAPAISFTMLPLSLVLSVSRQNGLDWDAIISCQMLGVYKPNAQAYLQAALWIGVEPESILMVACHNFDLNAARACGYKTAFVRRPLEWGPAGPPDPIAHPDCDIVVDQFEELEQRLSGQNN
jgi:2-haloacid dehalogenase